MSKIQVDDPMDALIRAREKLVQQRRNLAASLGDDYQRGHTDERRSQFIEVQQTLEAVDRAIDDERALRDTHAALDETPKSSNLKKGRSGRGE